MAAFSLQLSYLFIYLFIYFIYFFYFIHYFFNVDNYRNSVYNKKQQ